MIKLSCDQIEGHILINADKSQCVEVWLRNNSKEYGVARTEKLCPNSEVLTFGTGVGRLDPFHSAV